jgi:uncharacterized protein YegL
MPRVFDQLSTDARMSQANPTFVVHFAPVTPLAPGALFMASKLDRIEFAENPDPRCPCVLLLDVSTSMAGASIEALNAGLQAFQTEVARDPIAARRVEIAVVTFSSGAETVQEFVTADQFSAPALSAHGQTHVAAGLDRALDLIEQRKASYRQSSIPYYRPWVFLITDGAPSGESDEAVEAARQRLLQEQEANKLAFFAVGTDNADVEKLATFTRPDRPPLRLKGLQFVDLFVWLSWSQQAIAKSHPGEQVPLPPTGWAAV